MLPVLAGLVTCSGHEHNKDQVYIDEEFHLSVDQLFELVFTDSEFYRGFLKERKTYGKGAIDVFREKYIH